MEKIRGGWPTGARTCPYLFGGRVRLGRVGAAFATRLPPRPNPCEPSPCAALAADPSATSLRAGFVSIASSARAAILDFRSGLDPASEVVRVRDLSSIFRTASPFFRVLATFRLFSRPRVFFPPPVFLLPLGRVAIAFGVRAIATVFLAIAAVGRGGLVSSAAAFGITVGGRRSALRVAGVDHLLTIGCSVRTLGAWAILYVTI